VGAGRRLWGWQCVRLHCGKGGIMRQFTCPACMKVVELPDSVTGHKEDCPACGKVVRWPNPNRQPGPKIPPRLSGWWARQKPVTRVAASGLVVIVVFAAGIAAYLLRGSFTPARIPAGESWVNSGVSVRIKSASVSGGNLALLVSVSNTQSSAMFFSGWRRSAGRNVSITDSTGITHGQTPVDHLVEDLVGLQLLSAGFGPGLVNSGDSRIELLYFYKPAADVTYLDLDLSASAVGCSGTIRFRIPAEMWQAPRPGVKR
jgi:hypothetical protein